MQIIENLVQGTPEWLAIRCGIITMSELDPLTVSGKCKETGFGAGALTYMNKLIAERITGLPADDWQGNRYTEQGHELEPLARSMYVERHEVAIREVGIILNHDCGYSPDGLVGNDGAVEIKTKKPHLQVEVILGNKVPDEHYHQCMGGLWVSDREWIDFISYSKGMPLFVKRLYRDEKLFAQYQTLTEKFYWHMERRMQKVLGVDLGIAA